MQERRKHPRASVDLPVTVQLSQQHILTAKMIELSMEGIKFLCPMAPEINSEIELRFSLPSKNIVRELRFNSIVKHLYEVHATPGTPPDYRYVVGANFTKLQKDERAVLDNFLMK